MLRHRSTTTVAERVTILERASAGETDAMIAASLGCSIWTVRKWRRRGQHYGHAGLIPRRGRPATEPLGSVPQPLREAILTLRRAHPGWGATTILAELRADSTWQNYPLPSRSRIAALFKHAKLTRRYSRHSDLPSPTPASDAQPHDEWELDAQGWVVVDGLGKVCLVNVLDVVRRLKVESYPCLHTTNPPLATYQLTLRRAFLTTGLPRRISFDHGTVFFDNTTTSPFPTRLHLWLLALGVDVRFTRIRRPTDHAKIERLHQTMTLQALLGQHWADPQRLWAGLDARRDRLNRDIPSRVLGGQTPLQAYPNAAHSGRYYRPEWEADLLDLNRVYHYLATCRWFRLVKNDSCVVLGGTDYSIGKPLRGQAMEITFDAPQCVFLANVIGTTKTIALPPQRMAASDLMGELSDFLALPSYQLVLPFSHEAWRQLTYTQMLTGTDS
jgi:transposase InsO family protein